MNNEPNDPLRYRPQVVEPENPYRPPQPQSPAAQPQPQQPPHPPVHKPTLSSAAPPREQPSTSKLKSILSTLLILLIAPVLALSITAFVFQSYEVEGPSMETTLYTQDRLIIWKVPRTWARITNKDYVPKRNEVIVFVKQGLFDFNSNKDKQLIKRVVGLPGDRIVVKDGDIMLYNDEYRQGVNVDSLFPEGKNIGESSGALDITVPPGEVFVVGDNRGNSSDSRNFGTVPVSDIVGKLVIRLLPVDSARSF